MVFNSLGFLVFFPVVLLLYRILPLKIRWVMLLIASYYFYMSWQADLICLILFTTLVSYIAGRVIEKSKSQRVRKAALIVAICASLFVLIFFKYFNFLAQNVESLLLYFGKETSLTLNLILPVGISFYTFQTLSYVIDVYRGSIEAERHFGYYALYVSFFPQLVAGPIERPENLIPQLKTKNPFTVDDTVCGLKMMALGFFKKIVVADQIAVYVNNVYNGVTTQGSDAFNGLTVAIATVLFAFQIYCDFSGYTDIAIGCARIMGIRLMQNFNFPYTATTIKDFWRRWHISLSSWFTDYIYIPMGGSRVRKFRHFFNLLFVFLVSGIWHGAAWTFILWGVMHGVFQIAGNITKPVRDRLFERVGVSRDNAVLCFVRRILTFVLVCISWIAFRANSMSDMLVLYKTLFTGWKEISILGSLDAMGLSLVPLLVSVFSVVLMSLLDRELAIDTEREVYSNKLRFNSYVLVGWIIVFCWILLLASGNESSFIYFQF